MTRQHNVQARVEAEANREGYFFRNVLRAEGEFQDALQTMTGQYPNTQKARLPYITVSDDLRYIHRKGGRSLTLMSQNDFTQYDQRLTVLRDGSGDADSVQRQRVGILDFNTDTYVSTDFRVPSDSGAASMLRSAGWTAGWRGWEAPGIAGCLKVRALTLTPSATT